MITFLMSKKTHVKWDFLLYVLGRGGISKRWRRWIFYCVSTVSSIFINSSPSGFFESSRCSRQGHPLSPMLFVIVMEAIIRMIDCVNGGCISGFSLGTSQHNPLTVSHLLFADDTILCDANFDQIVHLCHVLKWFEVGFGLNVNLSKSELVPVGMFLI